MIHRDIRYRRFQRRNAIQHKVKIAASSFSFSPEYFGVHDKSMHNYSASDRRKFMSMQEQITEYYTAA